MCDDISAEIAARQEEQKRKEKIIVSTIQQQTESELNNGQNWETFDPLKPCMDKFEEIAKRNNLENDNQTRIFAQFLSIASNFASADFNLRLKIIPELVSTIKELIEEIINEIKQFKDLALEVQDIIRTFVQMVNETKHAVKMTLPHIKDVTNHIEILKDCFDPAKNSISMTEDDKNDVKLALNGVQLGIKNLKQLSYERGQESKEIRKRIDNARTQILDKKLTASGRLDSINQYYEAIYGKLGLSIGGTIIGMLTEGKTGAVSRAVAGVAGAGAVVGTEIAAVTITTASIIGFFLASAIGAVSITGIVLLVKKLYTRHQEKAIKCSNKLLIELEKISEANAFFLSYVQKSRELVNNTLVSMANIQNGICSERYRKNNAECCEAIIKDNKDMIETLNQISSINLEEWVNSLKIDEMVKIENSSEIRSIEK